MDWDAIRAAMDHPNHVMSLFMTEQILTVNPDLFKPKPLAVRITRLKCPTCGWSARVFGHMQTDRGWLHRIWNGHLNSAVRRFKRGAKAL